MSKANLTVKDIARISGVSPSTVSFVMNGRKGVAKETRDKVIAVIHQTGYQPNMASLRLSSKKSFNIAVVYPNTASPFVDFFYYEVTSGINERAQKEDYNVVFAELKGTPPHYQLPNVIQRCDADGVIFLQGVPASILESMDDRNIPFVLVDLLSPEDMHTNVSIDCGCAIYTAASYLIKHRHKRIAFLASDKLPSYFLNCFSGYQRALFENSLLIHPAWVCRDAHDEHSTATALYRLLDLEEPITAICCSGDLIALHAIKAAKARGLILPNQLSIISIDDILPSRFVDPALTTITFDNHNMGRLAAELLFLKMAGKPVKNIVVPSDNMSIRDSVAFLDD